MAKHQNDDYKLYVHPQVSNRDHLCKLAMLCPNKALVIDTQPQCKLPVNIVPTCNCRYYSSQHKTVITRQQFPIWKQCNV